MGRVGLAAGMALTALLLLVFIPDRSEAYIYWTDDGNDQISRAENDGTNIAGASIGQKSRSTGVLNQALVSSTGSQPSAVAVNSSHIFWANFSPSSIGRANLDGTGVNQDFIPRTGSTSALAVDGRVTPPTLTIDSGPSGSTADTTPTFGFTAQSGSTVTCSIDQGTPDFGPCSTSTTHTAAASLDDGDWDFRVKAVNGLGGENTMTRQFTVDTVAPDTVIDDHPLAVGPHGVAYFAFHSTEAGSSFECQLDDSDWLLCSSPVSLPVELGSHAFQVRATDEAGHVDPSAASFSFVVDRSDPETTIDSGPEGTIEIDQATFTFGSNRSPVDFYCSIDGGDVGICASPKTYTGLSNGQHEFVVYAVDEFGFDDTTPATRTFTVNKPGPVDPDPPSNAFTFGKLKLNKKQGTATLQVKVPGAGRLAVIGSKTVAPSAKASPAQGTFTLTIRAKGTAAITLRKRGRVTLQARVRFTPSGGEAGVKAKAVKLVKLKAKKLKAKKLKAKKLKPRR